jgi:predicted nuclease with TOPRIM domain
MAFLGIDATLVLPFGVAALAFLGGGISSYLVFRGTKMNVAIGEKSANTQQVETIFNAYSHVVDDLQSEVNRLKELLNNLRIEQQICEERNMLLVTEVAELKIRIGNLGG